MNEEVWVVGAQGLVGKEVMKFLKAHHINHVGSTHRDADITDIEALKEFYNKEKPTHIFNCSAHVHVDFAENEERELAYKVNVQGVVNLAQIASRNQVKLVHVSTDYVFDGEKEADYIETDPASPVNHYGVTKLDGEQKMLEICPDAVSVRTAWLYGPTKQGLVSKVIQMLETKEEAKGIIDMTSTPTYVPHLVKALWDLRNEKGIFHFVNKGFASRFELVEEVRNLALEKSKPIKCNRIIGLESSEFGLAAVRPKRSVLSTQKIEKHLNWPIPTWQAALREYLGEIGWIG